jgi:hypothetical protein
MATARNTTQRANARPTPKSPPEPGSADSTRSQAAGLERLAALAAENAGQVTDEAPGEPWTSFQRAYVRWLRARAVLDDPDVSHTDEEGKAGLNEVDHAARALLTMPVFCEDMFWWKWEVLEHFVSADATEGRAFDNRTVTALGCIKADLIRLGIGNGEGGQ